MAPRKLKPEPGIGGSTAVLVKEELAAALALPAEVAEKRAAAGIPILSCLRLQVSGGELLVAGTDMDIAVETRAQVKEHDWRAGEAVAVSAALLKAVVAAAPKDGEIRLRVGPTALLASHPLERARLPVLPADEFPAPRELTGELVAVQVEADKLTAALGRVGSAISREEARYYLQGVCLELAGSDLLLTATDGHRLHHARVTALDVEGDGLRERSPILPRRLVELLGAAEVELTLHLYGDGVVAAGGFGRITSRVIDGTFPDWRRLVPAEKPDALEVTGSELVDAVKRLRGFGDGPLRVWLESTRITLQGADDIEGEIAETVITGEPRGCPAELKTGFQGKYLAALAATAGSGRLVLSWDGETGPLRAAYVDRPDDVAVLMPFRAGTWLAVE